MTVINIYMHAYISACGEYSKNEDNDHSTVLLSLGIYTLILCC